MNNIKNITSKQENKDVKHAFMTALDVLRMKNIERHDLIDQFIPSGVIAFLIGSSDTGKSMLARQIATCAALGRKTVAGFKMNTRFNRSMYISTEDGISEWQQKLKMYNLTSAEQEEGLKNLFLEFDYENLNPRVLESRLKKTPVDIIVIDAFADMFQGDLNKATDVRDYLKPYQYLAETYHCTILFIHHVNKNSEKQSPSKHHLSGSHAIEAKARCVINLSKDTNEIDARYLLITKANYLPESVKRINYKLILQPNLTFEFAGVTVNKAANIGGTDQEIITKVLELHNQNLSCQKISDKLKELGIKIGKSKVNIIVRKYSKKSDNEEGDELSAT